MTTPNLIPKFLGRDDELSTTGFTPGESIDSWKVTQLVLAQMDAAFAARGVRTWTRPTSGSPSAGNGWSSAGWGGGGAWGGYQSAASSDCLRHWVGSGQCYYSDMGHVEACTCATLDPLTFAAQGLSTLVAAEEARALAEAEEEEGTRLVLTAANVDMADPAIAWGTHLNVSVSEELFSDLFLDRRHPAVLGFVASGLAALIPFFGCGYLLPLKDGSTIYSLSARAHHLSSLSTYRTTEAYHRGLLNERQEAHALGQDRLHLIGFDFCLTGAALMASVVQCMLAAAEQGFCNLNLYDPVRALRSWSWSLDIGKGTLPGEARRVDGRHVTLPAYMRELVTTLLGMVQAGLIPETVAPRAGELLPRVLHLCDALERGDLMACAVHLDWAAKLMVLLDKAEREGLSLGDDRMRLADHDYANTDPAIGVFWTLWEAGQIDPLVSRSEVEACLVEGPAESRDWSRGQLIETFHDHVTSVDWDHVELRRGGGRWDQRLRIPFPAPGWLAKDRMAPLLDGCDDPEELHHRLSAAETSLRDPLLDVDGELAQGPDA